MQCPKFINYCIELFDTYTCKTVNRKKLFSDEHLKLIALILAVCQMTGGHTDSEESGVGTDFDGFAIGEKL